MKSSGRILQEWGRTAPGSGRSLCERSGEARCGDESCECGDETGRSGDETCGVGDEVYQSGDVMRESADEACEVRDRLRMNGGRMRESGDEPAAGGQEADTVGAAARVVPPEVGIRRRELIEYRTFSFSSAVVF